jgi:predicted membrane protein (TIGR00267 family)
MGLFSGFVATYLSERAERLRELHETERAMLHPLRGSIYERAARLVPLYVAFWSGLGVTLLPLLGIAPFIADAALGLSMATKTMVYASAAIIVGELFGLGAYLGHISGENKLLSGLRLAAIGAAAVAFFAVLGAVL